MGTPARNWKYVQPDVRVLLLAVIWRCVTIQLLFKLLLCVAAAIPTFGTP